jgi:RND family efflux transporter MFP subunit
MNKVMLSLLLSVGVLAGCGKQESVEQTADVVRPVKTMLIEAAGAGGQRNFPGRVEAANRATLSFQVAGKLEEILVKEGQDVTAGQTLARLDPKDFQVVVNDRAAIFKRSEADYKRAKDLVEKGHISRSDYDKLEANFISTRAALEQARNDLSYTELKAPFAGTVSKRLVENFEQVNAKQEVLELRDLENLEIKFDVPENLVQRLRKERPGESGAREAAERRVHASFAGLPGQRFELAYKEAATQADAKTQTFEITMTMPRPQGLQILPGMTANVAVTLAGLIRMDEIRYRVPANAVVGDNALEPRVWLVEPETLTVKARQVKVGKLRGRDIEVLEGLEPGDRIVIAGVAYLAEGMKVSLLPTPEQAQPRADDPS